MQVESTVDPEVQENRASRPYVESELIVRDSGTEGVYYSGRSSDAGTTSPSLIERLRINPHDLEAGARLLRVYTAYVRRLCSAPGRQPADVDDIAGKVLDKMIRKLQRFEFQHEKASFRPWVHAIARNECVTWIRRQPREQAAGNLLDDLPATEDEYTPSNEDQRTLFVEAYRSVKEDWRGDPRTIEAFEKTSISGCKPSAVAAELGVPAQFVYNAKLRVCQEVRRVLLECGALD